MTNALKEEVPSVSVEVFQPVPITSPAERPIFFWLRCLVDLQLATIVQYLRPALTGLGGQVVDVGAGEAPWRAWLPPGVSYQGIDVGHAGDFGMTTTPGDIIYYDGKIMPLPDNTFDAALCIEVLEHAEDPQLLLSEISRILKADATLLLSVPWSARRHHIPHDYHRFTPERLQRLLEVAGFSQIKIRERGNDIGVIANKVTVLALRLMCPKRALHAILTWPLGIVCGVLAAGFLVAAHLSVIWGFGSIDDPLGYFVHARKHRL
ncbi:MAG: class I SAM-dependent methyltransferase [Pseudomonadota bacterium]